MANPLRVLLLTSRLSPAAGGLAVSVPALANNIARFNDIEVHVMGTLDAVHPTAANVWGPKVHALPIRGPSSVQYAPEMRPALATLKPGLVDVQGLWTYASFANLRHARASGTPYIITPRGMLDPWARRNSRWKKQIAAAAFETSHLRNARCLRATAEMEAQHFRDMGLTNPIAIVPNGLQLPELAVRTEAPLRQLLFLSRIHPKKGIVFLLNSWATLEPLFPSWEVVIAGIDENGHEAELKQLAKSLQLTRVRFVGERHGLDKQNLYRNADLFVLPTHAENFGLVVAEALAQETPVVTTTNAPWAGLQKHDCGWWITLDQVLLTKTLQVALSLPSERLAAMGRRGRDWVQRDFSPGPVAERMREVYLWVSRGAPKPDHVYE